MDVYTIFLLFILRWTIRWVLGCEKFLPGPAWLLLSKTGSPFSASLYTACLTSSLWAWPWCCWTSWMWWSRLPLWWPARNLSWPSTCRNWCGCSRCRSAAEGPPRDRGDEKSDRAEGAPKSALGPRRPIRLLMLLLLLLLKSPRKGRRPSSLSSSGLRSVERACRFCGRLFSGVVKIWVIQWHVDGN